jgi:adenosylhomocysteine nucleosidase
VVRLGVVTGLRNEARCLATFPMPLRPEIRCAGANAGRARSAARDLLVEGCDALLSFGIAGGLDPLLEPGTTIVADAVVTQTGQKVKTTDWWRERLLRTLNELPAVRGATIAGSDWPITTEVERLALREASGAAAVDMESHAVAEVASDAEVPFLALRVVADTFTDFVPMWVNDCISGDGSIKPLALTTGIIAHPADIVALLRLARTSRAALNQLHRALLLAGPQLCAD